jgi:signal transduction histidine kinase
MKKHALWVVLILTFAGIILGTLGTWSVPLGYGISAFWPAFIVQVAGSVWFGGWGVLAAVIFPVLTNALANVGLSGMLGFIPANLVQGLIPAWAFRHFRVDPAIPGRKEVTFYMLWGSLIPAVAGGLLGSIAVILFGQAAWSDYPLLVVKWAAPHVVVSLLIGIPIMRELTPLWRDLGLLVKDWWSIEEVNRAAFKNFRDMPIQLKLILAMCGAGLGPLLALSLLELARNGGKSAMGSVTPLFLTISLASLAVAVGVLSRETVRSLQELKEQVESLVTRRDGALIVERTDEIGQLGRAFAFLLDERRRADTLLQAGEEKLRRLNEELEQRVVERTIQLETANKELEAFSYSISHDLRAPLRGIDGWSQALLEDYHDKLDEQGRQYIDRVRSETQRMGYLIEDMLQLSRLTRAEVRKEPVDLSALARAIVDRLQKEELQRRVDFVIQENLVANGDVHLLESALVNLLGNAFKFTGARANARIEFGQTEMENQRVFFVRDNGAGFDMAYAEKLFTAFQRMHKAAEFPGTGIGLATVQRIIRRHGGKVWAEAKVNEGAVFYFIIPE